MTERRLARVLTVEPPEPAGGAVASIALFVASLVVAVGFAGYVAVRELAPEPPTVPLSTVN